MGRLIRGLPMAVGAVALGAAALGGCGDDGRRALPPSATRGDAEIGRDLISSYGCGSCHRVPGVRGADGLVGPPLDAMGRRTFIAGRLANTQENMIRWLVDPLAVDPRTAMPDLDVSEADAAHMSAYLAGLD